MLLCIHSYSIFVEFIGQSAARESHPPGGFGLCSPGGRERLQDQIFFGSLQQFGEIERIRTGQRE